MSEHPNVFILSLDSLREASFQRHSERIADLVDGLNFPNAVAPASHTGSAMPPLTTGKFVDEHSISGLPPSGNPKPVAEYFSEMGYTCGLWTDNYLFGGEYNYDRGFDAGNRGRPRPRQRIANYLKESQLSPVFGVLEWTYFNVYHRIRSKVLSEESFYRSAEELNKRFLSWLDEPRGDRPIFCWIHYMDNHHPYEPPEAYLDRQPFRGDWTRPELGEFTRNAIKPNGLNLSNDELHDLECAYEATCAYAGDQIVALIEELIERGDYDPNSDVMVVTADHGECLQPEPYGMLGHVPPAFWEDIVNVPLVVGRPDWPSGNDDRQVSLIDLFSMILNPIAKASEAGRQIPEPANLHRTTARFVTQWEHHDSDMVRTYRGVRQEDGTKCFGAFRHDEDQIVYAGLSRGEEEIYGSWAWENFTPPDLSTECSKLYQTLVEYGGAVQYGSTTGGQAQIDEKHLRNLGYLE